MPAQEIALTDRWTPLRYHETQYRLQHDDVRFKVCAAGRRSGKTERAKRHGVMAAIRAIWQGPKGFRLAFMAPTYSQAKEVYWRDVQRLVPKRLVKSISHSELTLELISPAGDGPGPRIQCIGMNAPARAEGSPLHAAYWDEAGDQKEGAFEMHVMPALDTPGQEGYAWIYGVPRSGGGFREYAERAQDPTIADMAFYTWPSADILTPEQIAAAKARMDERVFRQEYEATFVNFSGRIYYPFERHRHASERVLYDPQEVLSLCLDFNVEPGTAVVVQEQTYRGDRDDVAERFTAAIGEVFIPHDSNTPMVCRKLAQDWGPDGVDHQGIVRLWGDATGGARKTSQTEGTDWDLAENILRPVFGERLQVMRKRSNPAERARVNAVNSRLEAADGTIRHLVDPVACPQLVKDYEEVVAKEGTNGEIDKDPKRFKMRTHLSDGAGYYIEAEHPVDDGPAVIETAMW